MQVREKLIRLSTKYTFFSVYSSRRPYLAKIGTGIIGVSIFSAFCGSCENFTKVEQRIFEKISVVSRRVQRKKRKERIIQEH